MFWLLLLCASTPWEWTHEGKLFTNVGCWSAAKAGISPDGERIALTNENHTVWLLTQDAVEAVTINETRIWQLAIDNDTVYVYGYTREQGSRLLAYDLTTRRVRLNVEGRGFHNLQIVDGKLLAAGLDSDVGKPMLSLYDTKTLELESTFFKATPQIQRMIDDSGLWAAARGDLYLVASEVRDRIYFATPARRAIERNQSNTLPNSYPFLDLQLGPSWVRPKQRAVKSQLVRNDVVGLVEFYQDFFNQSRVVFFSAWGEQGYVLAYEIPDRLDGFLVGNHLGIRFLDQNLRPVGPVVERYGQFLGVAQGHAVILYPNGPEPIPGEPNALQTHYGIHKVEKLVDLSTHLRSYRAQVDGKRRILVERLRPQLDPIVE